MAHPASKFDAVLEQVPVTKSTIQPLDFVFHGWYLSNGLTSECKYLVVSVENFYLVLYEHLLKPLGWIGTYAHPFGTKDGMCWLYQPGQLVSQTVLFHHDQEPIYPGDETWINLHTPVKYLPRLLANSEHSAIKTEICRADQLGDWYFFYHGFAALDWYRDAIFIDYQKSISKAFLSLNHLVNDRRSYRMALIARFYQRDLQHFGTMSFHGDRTACQIEVAKQDSLLSESSKDLVIKYLTDQSLPITIDELPIDGTASANFAHGDISLRQQALFSIVNETVFFEPKLHLTEKIFQPIVCSRPFILAAAPGNLAYLRSYGFRTFGDWIDESYDSIQDPDQRMDRIADIVADICARPLEELQSMLDDMQPVLEHNKRHFFGGFQRIIVDELVDNFNRCIDTWNGWRVTGRIFPTHPDPAAVKEILLR